MARSPERPPFPPALSAPPGDVVRLDADLVARAVRAARRSPRGRVLLPFHAAAADPLHRMLNALQPGSYVRPHRHLEPPKAEAVVVLRGAIEHVVFVDDGAVRSRAVLSAGGDAFGVDTRPGVYHTFWARERDSVVFEVKPGPYDAATDKDFAPWAPAEGSPEADRYLAGLEGRTYEIRPAHPGERVAVEDLLRAARLPTEDVVERFSGFLVAAEGPSAVVGAIGLEVHGREGLLRSLVVAPGWRGAGTGARLVQRLLRDAWDRGVEELYLLTTDAAPFFERLGFEPRDRATAPEAIRRTREFRELCPASAAMRMLPLRHGPISPQPAVHRWFRFEPPPVGVHSMIVAVAAEDTVAASRFARETLEPRILQRQSIALDFVNLPVCTQSFLHALLYEPLRLAWATRTQIYIVNAAPAVQSTLSLLESYALGG